ncbi:MAG: hypothetical protein U0441_09180 [Polyangiaceae bacterium]
MPSPRFFLYGRALSQTRHRCMLLSSEPAWPDEAGKLVRFPPAKTALPIGALFNEGAGFFAAEVKSIADEADLELSDREGGVEAFRGLQTLQKHQNTGEAELRQAVGELRAEDAFVVALVQAYITDAALVDHAKISSEAQLAVLSELVFEVEHATPKSFQEQTLQIAGQAVKVEVRWPKPVSARPVRVVAEQRSTGVYFSWGQDFDALAALRDLQSPPDGARVRLRRSIGAYPDPEMPILREFLFSGVTLVPATDDKDRQDLSESKLIAIDDLRPTDLAGQLLHYQVELCDAHNQVLAQGGVSLRRERLDPPLPPDSAEATLEVRGDEQNRTLVLKPSWTQLEKTGRADIFLEVYAEERELDECGFYGGDDDLALLEAARAADIDASGEGNTKINDAFNRVAAENDRRGLLRVHEISAADLPAGDEIALTLPSLSFMSPGKGYRLYVGARRKIQTPGMTSASALVPCQHKLTLLPGSGDKTDLNVFQLELFEKAPPLRFLDASTVTATALLRVPATPLVRLTWRHLSDADAPERVGGYQLYRRDILGAADPTPFVAADLVEALPPLVAQYQPMHFEASAPFRFVAVKPDPPTVTARPANLDAAKGLLDAAVDALCKALPGRSRLPAGPDKGAKADKPSGGEKQPSSAEYIQGAATSEPSPAPLTPDPAYEWAVIGRLVHVLADAGLVKDIVVSAGGALDFLAALRRELENGNNVKTYGSVKVLLARTRDEVLLRTFRVLVLPPMDWQNANLPPVTTVPGRACRRFLAAPNEVTLPGEPKPIAPAPRIEELRDVSTSPVRLTVTRSRELHYVDESLRDGWHHDLEWRIQKLDRYDRVRADLHPEQKPLPPDPPKPDRRTISVAVPRTEPVKETPVVLAAQTRGDAAAAFHVMDTRQGTAAAANALARTRAGRISCHHTCSQQLPEQNKDPIAKALSGWKVEQQQKAIDDWTLAFSDKDPAPRAAERLIVPDPALPGVTRVHALCGAAWDVLARMYPAPEDSAHETAPLPGATRVVLPLAPYYLDHTLVARITADEQASSEASATTRRAPRQIGLARRPRFSVGPDGRSLTLRILPSLLGTHLSGAEHRALPADRPKLRDFGLPDAVGAWPVEMVPDLWSEYILYCNAGTLDQIRAIELGVVTRPPPGTPATALGFLFRASPGATSPKLTFQDGVLVVECQLAGDLPVVTEKDPAVLSSRLFVKLRRGRATSDMIALVPRG